MYSLMERPVLMAGRVIFVLMVWLSVQLVQAAPVSLSDVELDRISAGYVDLEVSARATAEGPNAVARFSADVEQTIGDAQLDNYIYTTTTGLAEAFAKGRRVSTEVGYFFQTDEEVLSFEVVHKSSSHSTTGKHGNKRKQRKQKKRKLARDKKNKANKSRKRNRNKKGKGNQKTKRKNHKKRSKKRNVTRERQQLYVSIVTRRRVE